MAKHADIMRPKFEKVLEILDSELGDTGVASWTKPRGGYFISFDTMNGCASKVVALCKEAGVVFTSAGATHPYGVDPEDKNIRIAPSFATVDEIDTAAKLFCLATKIVSLEKLLAE
jgi:DNA-binding transcriptional MocR family regulator